MVFVCLFVCFSAALEGWLALLPDGSEPFEHVFRCVRVRLCVVCVGYVCEEKKIFGCINVTHYHLICVAINK